MCLSLWIYDCLGKIQWNIIPSKRRFLESFKSGRCYWCRYVQSKGVRKQFEVKYLGEYHDLYVQIDTLLSDGVFENFRNIFLKIYELDPVKYLSTP